MIKVETRRKKENRKKEYKNPKLTNMNGDIYIQDCSNKKRKQNQ
jgi:hypothetical protein